jgi:Xaa-Pro aminopeptidase
MDHGARRATIAVGFDALGIDALLVSRLPNVRYLSGFTGSSGLLLVAAEDAVLITDGRYMVQASREAPDVRTRRPDGAVPPAVAAAGR